MSSLRSRKCFITIDLFNIDLLFPKTFEVTFNNFISARRLKKKKDKMRQNKVRGIKEVRIIITRNAIEKLLLRTRELRQTQK